MMLIQIYEIQTPEEAKELINLDIDHIGSVITDINAKKNENLLKTVKTTQENGKKSSIIPLFNEKNAVFEVLEYYSPDIVHFIDALVTEDERYYDRLIKLQKEIKKRFEYIQIMRSIPIATPGNSESIQTLNLAKKFEEYTDFFLTDTYSDPIWEANQADTIKHFGITGKICDWDVAAKLVNNSKIPVILAGGISPENVIQGIETVKPAGIDSCSLTNMTDSNEKPVRFKKDLNKVKALVERVRSLTN